VKRTGKKLSLWCAHNKCYSNALHLRYHTPEFFSRGNGVGVANLCVDVSSPCA
jgi:hypothetical protein